MLSVFGSNVAQFSGAGALGVLVMATMASYGWGDIEKVGVGLMYIQDHLRKSQVFFGEKIKNNYSKTIITKQERTLNWA